MSRWRPVLAATAAGQREATLGAGHVAVIRRFYHQLPGWIDHSTREHAEADLARQGLGTREGLVVVLRLWQ